MLLPFLLLLFLLLLSILVLFLTILILLFTIGKLAGCETDGAVTPMLLLLLQISPFPKSFNCLNSSLLVSFEQVLLNGGFSRSVAMFSFLDDSICPFRQISSGSVGFETQLVVSVKFVFVVVGAVGVNSGSSRSSLIYNSIIFLVVFFL